MRLSHSVSIAGSVSDVFATLSSVRALAEVLECPEIDESTATISGSHASHVGPWIFEIVGSITIAESNEALRRVVFHVDGTAPARASRVRGEIIATMSHKDDEVLLSLASDIGTAGALAQFSDAVFASALHSLYDGIALRLSSQSTGDFQSAAKTPVPSGEFAEKTKSRQTDMSNGTPSQDVDREVRPRGWRRRN